MNDKELVQVYANKYKHNVIEVCNLIDGYKNEIKSIASHDKFSKEDMCSIIELNKKIATLESTLVCIHKGVEFEA